MVKILRTSGTREVLDYIKTAPASKPSQFHSFDRVDDLPVNGLLSEIDPSDDDVHYILEVVKQVVDLVVKDLNVVAVTERHLDLAIFGKAFEVIGKYIFREVQGTVSRTKRRALSGKSGYFVDYLRVVSSLTKLYSEIV